VGVPLYFGVDRWVEPRCNSGMGGKYPAFPVLADAPALESLEKTPLLAQGEKGEAEERV